MIMCTCYGHNVIVFDTTKTQDVSGKIQVSNGGFAPIPAFSFNSPILIASLALTKRSFSFEPDVAIGLNGRPWMGNNWFRYKFLNKRKIKLKAGINPFLFYYDEKADTGEDKIHIQRNLTVEFFGEIILSENTSIQMIYRHNNGWDGALTGHFIGAKSIHQLHLIKNLTVEIKPELFYFNFTKNLDGFFGSAAVQVKHIRLPISLYCQGVIPCWTGFVGSSFKVFSGLIYEF